MSKETSKNMTQVPVWINLKMPQIAEFYEAFGHEFTRKYSYTIIIV